MSHIYQKKTVLFRCKNVCQIDDQTNDKLAKLIQKQMQTNKQNKIKLIKKWKRKLCISLKLFKCGLNKITNVNLQCIFQIQYIVSWIFE